MEIETITASHSRKIQHEHYGGQKFEGTDHFCSMSASVEIGEDVKEVHRELMLACREMVNTSVAHDILKIQGGLGWTDFMGQLRQYRLGKLELTDEIFHSWTEQQKAIYEEMKKLKRALPKEEELETIIAEE
jgi:hypothetical protein